MNCDETRTFLQDDVDGMLSEAAHRTVAAHLEECPVCTIDRDALDRMEASLRKDRPYPVPPGMVDRVMTGIFAPRTFSLRRELLRLSAAAAGFLVVSSALLFLDWNHIQKDENFKLVTGSVQRSVRDTADLVENWIDVFSKEE